MRRVTVPPYCGFPRLSHQFPFVAVVVVLLVVVVVDVVVGFDAVVEEGVDIDVDVDVNADVDVDAEQDASSIATIIKMLKPNQITLFFILPSILILNILKEQIALIATIETQYFACILHRILKIIQNRILNRIL